MFLDFPQTKTNFNHLDLSHGSKDLETQGGKIMGAFAQAANHLDNLEGSLSKLSDLDPGNFTMMSQSMKKVMTSHFPDDFDTITAVTFDKFVLLLSRILFIK